MQETTPGQAHEPIRVHPVSARLALHDLGELLAIRDRQKKLVDPSAYDPSDDARDPELKALQALSRYRASHVLDLYQELLLRHQEGPEGGRLGDDRQGEIRKLAQQTRTLAARSQELLGAVLSSMGHVHAGHTAVQLAGQLHEPPVDLGLQESSEDISDEAITECVLRLSEIAGAQRRCQARGHERGIINPALQGQEIEHVLATLAYWTPERLELAMQDAASLKASAQLITLRRQARVLRDASRALTDVADDLVGSISEAGEAEA